MRCTLLDGDGELDPFQQERIAAIRERSRRMMEEKRASQAEKARDRPVHSTRKLKQQPVERCNVSVFHFSISHHLYSYLHRRV